METHAQEPLDVVVEALDTVRTLLDMDVSYISEADQTHVTFRHVSGGGSEARVTPGRALPLQDMFCAHIANGTIPPVIGDTDAVALLKELRFTQEAKIRSLISVPINRSDGSLYGMFCCYGHRPRPCLNHRDLKTVRMFADLASRSLNMHIDASAMQRHAANQINDIIDRRAIETYRQPIVSLSDKTPMAAEALSRFRAQGPTDPMTWFNLAGKANMSLELELAAIAQAISHLDSLPERMYMTVNASPETLRSPDLPVLLDAVPPDRLIVELTEHTVIDDLPGLTEALETLRARRIGIAIDDVGAGYAGLTTLLGLNADVLKLDRSLVSLIVSAPAKLALGKAMGYLANETYAFLVAEGVERDAEHQTLLQLGVRLGQGFLYQRPHPAELLTPLLDVQRAHKSVDTAAATASRTA